MIQLKLKSWEYKMEILQYYYKHPVCFEVLDCETSPPKNNTLKVALKFPETTADGKVRITVYYESILQVIDANEGATVTGKGIAQPQVEIKAQEGAFINMVVNVKHLKVKSTSGAVIKLSGSTKNQTVEANLGGMYHGYKLKVSDLNYVRAGSGSKVEVQSGETLDAKVSFGGSIFYKGTPEVFKDKKVINARFITT